MLYYNRIDVSESINVNKIICFFLDKEFRFQSSVSYGCVDLSTYGVVYHYIIFGIGNR